MIRDEWRKARRQKESVIRVYDHKNKHRVLSEVTVNATNQEDVVEPDASSSLSQKYGHTGGSR